MKSAQNNKQAATDAPAQRRFRPLGLSIAILSAAGLYGFYPMVPLLLIVLTQLRGHNIGSEVIDGIGWANIALGAATIIASIAAWIGRPPQTRRTLLALVWFATVLRLIQAAQGFNQGVPISSSQIGGNLSSVLLPVSLCQIPLLIIIPLYMTWYLNRAPARAFYKPS